MTPANFMAAFTYEKKLQIRCRIENLDPAHSKFGGFEILGSQIWSYQNPYDTSELWMPEIVSIYSLLTNGFPKIMCLTWNSLVY